jgi:hypothetical protein
VLIAYTGESAGQGPGPQDHSYLPPPAGDEINLSEDLTVETAIAEAARLLRVAELEAAVADPESPVMDRLIALSASWASLAGLLLATSEQNQL